MSASLARRALCVTSPLPGFGLSLGVTLAWLAAIVLLPFAVLLLRASSGGWHGFVAAVWSPRLLASYRLTFGTALAAAAINAVLGFLVAWMLARCRPRWPASPWPSCSARTAG